MIVPGRRLLFAVGTAGVPLASLAVALPSWPAAAALGVMIIVAILDAWRSRHLLAGIGVEVIGPRRLTEGRRGSITALLSGLGPAAVSLRLGIGFPDDLGAESEELRLRSNGAAPHTARWFCRPRRRGRYRLEVCRVERASHLGLWLIRRGLALDVEMRVNPDLHAERGAVAAMFLNRRLSGVHAQRQLGKGRDFEKLREYTAGDDYGDIHWKASAKRGRPLTKVFQIERMQEIYIVLDSSRLSGRSLDHDGKPSLDRCVTSAITLLMAAQRQGDAYGVITFSDRVHGFRRARTGKAHATSCLQSLNDLEPRMVSPDFRELAGFIRLRLRRRALLLFLTNLDDPLVAEEFSRSMALISPPHLVLTAMIAPPGVQPLFQGHDVAALDDIYRRLAGHIRWQSLRETAEVLKRRGVRFFLLRGESAGATLVSHYLSIRQRQSA